MWDPYADIEHDVLDNGLNVYCAHWDRPWVRVGFLVHSGAREDPPGKEGTAHFVEHLATENVPGQKPEELERMVKRQGGDVSFGATNDLCAKYLFSCPTDAPELARLFSFLGSLCLCAPLSDHVESERETILREIDAREPERFMVEWRRRWLQALFVDHWEARIVSVAGEPETVARITTADLERYASAHYVPANISVVAVGGLSTSAMVKHLRETPLGGHQPGARNPLPQPWRTVPPPRESRIEVRMSDHQHEPARYASVKVFALLPGTVPLQHLRIFEDLLDDVLYQTVRQRRRWAYHFDTDVSSFQDLHAVAIGGDVDPAVVDRVPEVVRECLDSLRGQRDLFELYRVSRVAGQRMLDVDGADLLKTSLKALEHIQRILTAEEIAERYDAVTFDDLQCLLDHLSPERCLVCVQHP